MIILFSLCKYTYFPYNKGTKIPQNFLSTRFYAILPFIHR